MTLDEQIKISVTPECGAYDFLQNTQGDVLAALEDLLVSIGEANTLLQLLRCFKNTREAVSTLIIERAKARKMLLKDGE